MNHCLNCNNETTNPSFCSRSCSVSYNNRKCPKRKKTKQYCLNCQKETTESIAIYCCQSCCIEHKKNSRDKTIFSNNGFLPNAVNNTIRSFLIRHNGNCCMLCGMDADNWQGKSLTLIVDHIDGKSKNNSLDNLRLVCPNCDSQLPTYKGKNKGNSDRSYFITQK